MRRSTIVLIISAAAGAQFGPAHAQSATQILTAGCADDAHKFCSDVPSGGGRIIACLKQHKDSLSDQCKQAAAQASKMSVGGAQSAAAAVPPTGSTASSANATDALIAAPAATTTGTSGSAAKPARASATSGSGKQKTAGAGGSYLVLKKVQITGNTLDTAHPTMPAYDLLIPSTWKMQGTVNSVPARAVVLRTSGPSA